MRVEEIMTREVVSLTMDDDLAKARDLFKRFRFRHLPVIGDEGKLAGVISDRDMLANLSPFAGTINERAADANSLRRKIHQFMTRHPQTTGRHERVERAALVMLHGSISCLPVVSAQGELEGIVTMRDVLRCCLNRAGLDTSERTGNPAA